MVVSANVNHEGSLNEYPSTRSLRHSGTRMYENIVHCSPSYKDAKLFDSWLASTKKDTILAEGTIFYLRKS